MIESAARGGHLRVLDLEVLGELGDRHRHRRGLLHASGSAPRRTRSSRRRRPGSAVAARPGATIGTTTRSSSCGVEAPSMRAASSSSRGTSRDEDAHQPQRHRQVQRGMGEDRGRRSVLSSPTLAEHGEPGAGQRDRRDHVEDQRPAEEAVRSPSAASACGAATRRRACRRRGTSTRAGSADDQRVAVVEQEVGGLGEQDLAESCRGSA